MFCHLGYDSYIGLGSQQRWCFNSACSMVTIATKEMLDNVITCCKSVLQKYFCLNYTDVPTH